MLHRKRWASTTCRSARILVACSRAVKNSTVTRRNFGNRQQEVTADGNSHWKKWNASGVFMAPAIQINYDFHHG